MDEAGCHHVECVCFQVTTEEGKAFADFHNISFIETSSKSSLYVQEAFTLIAREIYDMLIEGRIHVQNG